MDDALLRTQQPPGRRTRRCHLKTAKCAVWVLHRIGSLVPFRRSAIASDPRQRYPAALVVKAVSVYVTAARCRSTNARVLHDLGARRAVSSQSMFGGRQHCDTRQESALRQGGCALDTL